MYLEGKLTEPLLRKRKGSWWPNRKYRLPPNGKNRLPQKPRAIGRAFEDATRSLRNIRDESADKIAVVFVTERTRATEAQIKTIACHRCPSHKIIEQWVKQRPDVVHRYFSVPSQKVMATDALTWEGKKPAARVFVYLGAWLLLKWIPRRR